MGESKSVEESVRENVGERVRRAWEKESMVERDSVEERESVG